MTPRSPAEILRVARTPQFWREVVPSLRIDQVRPWSCAANPAADGERERLRRDGYARIERAAPAALVAALADGIRSLHDANIPTPAVYVFDEAWELAIALAPTFEALLGAPPRILPDIWAWFVPSEAGASGWAPHRGVTFDVRDQAGVPTFVNTWIALSDISEASACMHVVPLGDDPHYASALDGCAAGRTSQTTRLDRIDVDPARAIALPVPAGSLLAWNANVLHWGGAMKPGAPERISASFSLRTVTTPGDFAPTAPPAFPERVDLVADMLVTYAHASGVTGPWLEWARLWTGMRAARGR